VDLNSLNQRPSNNDIATQKEIQALVAARVEPCGPCMDETARKMWSFASCTFTFLPNEPITGAFLSPTPKSSERSIHQTIPSALLLPAAATSEPKRKLVSPVTWIPDLPCPQHLELLCHLLGRRCVPLHYPLTWQPWLRPLPAMELIVDLSLYLRIRHPPPMRPWVVFILY
jgi:hypothetical protein